MKLHNSMGPNPKLVRIFAAEKGFAFDETIEVDLGGGENRRKPYLSKNPAGQVPCVELGNGTIIAETVAICELIEERKPEPALIGRTPEERAETRMWVRRVEWKIIQPMSDGFRYAEGLPIFRDRILTLPDAADGLKSIARGGLQWLDVQLAGRATIVPGRFTLADIILYCFAEIDEMLGQPIDPGLANVTAWFEATAKRPGVRGLM